MEKAPSLEMHWYVLAYTAPDGKQTKLRATLGGDNEAKFWANAVVERDGGSASVVLKDGTVYQCP